MLNVPAAIGLLAPMEDANDAGGYDAPTIIEFFPPQLGDYWWSPPGSTSSGCSWPGARAVLRDRHERPTLIPGKLQNLGEIALKLVYVDIIDKVIRIKAQQFAPIIVTISMVLALTSPASCP